MPHTTGGIGDRHTITTEWPTDKEICDTRQERSIPLSAEALKSLSQYHASAMRFPFISRPRAPELARLRAMVLPGSRLEPAPWQSFRVLAAARPSLPCPHGRRTVFRLCMLTSSAAPTASACPSRTARSLWRCPPFTHISCPDAADRDFAGHPRQLNTPAPQGSGTAGTRPLRTAYSLLSQATSASEPARSELMLGANIALSSYEQARVQPALELRLLPPGQMGPASILANALLLPHRQLACRYSFYARPHQEQTPAMQSIEDCWVRMYSKTLWLKTAVGTVALGRPLDPPTGTAHPAAPCLKFKIKEVPISFSVMGHQIQPTLRGVQLAGL